MTSQRARRVLVVAGSDSLARAVERLGHEVATATTAGESVEVAVVSLEGDRPRGPALEQVRDLVDTRAYPVILHAPSGDIALMREAVRTGIYAHTTTLEPLALGTAIDLAVSRFAERATLESTMARRILVDRAKGILMERYGLDEGTAFEMLRRESRNANLKLLESAEIVARGHRLLPDDPRRPRRRRPGMPSSLSVSLLGWIAFDHLQAAELLPALMS